MDGLKQPWQFSIRTLLLFIGDFSVCCALFAAWQGIGIFIAVLLNGMALAILGKRRADSRLERVGYAMVAMPLLLYLLGCYTVYQTWFSPESFTFRSTQHTEALGVRLTRGSNSEWNRELIDYLRQEGYIKDVTASVASWDFVHGHMPSVRGWHGRAKDAYRAFRSEGLIEWSKSHPQHARYAWPIVVEHTRARRYFLARSITMELHGFDGSLEELKANIARCEANGNQ